MRRRISPKDAVVDAGVGTVFGPEGGETAKPFASIPDPPAGFQRVVEVVFDDVGWEADYERLANALHVEALSPGTIELALNAAEHHALDAHRLYVAAKVTHARYEADLEPVLGAMRAAATADLQREKDAGQRSKAITDADVRDRAATLYPDEWSAANERAEKAARTCEHLQRLADLWKGRPYSLSAMVGRR